MAHGLQGSFFLTIVLGFAINQILGNQGATQLLVSSATKDVLYTISPAEVSPVDTLEVAQQIPHRWACHPTDPELLFLLSNETLDPYDWTTLRCLKPAQRSTLGKEVLAERLPQSLMVCAQGRYLAATLHTSPVLKSRHKELLIWTVSDLSPSAPSMGSVQPHRVVSEQVRYLIGSYGPRLVFLNSEGWVCSLDPGNLKIERCTRHFFIPLDWMSANTQLMINVTSKGDIVFVKRHEIAVIKRGLETNEQGPHTAAARSPIRGSSRPSMTSSRSSGSDLFLKPYSDSKRPSLPVRKRSPDDVF